MGMVRAAQIEEKKEINADRNTMNQQVFGLNKREIAEILRHKEINPTTQRIEIAHLILQRPQHLSAEEIRNRLNKEYEQVSQATVYNTLRLFVEKSVIRELVFSPDRIYYDSNIKPHHHFVDVETGGIFDIPAESVAMPEITIRGIDAEITEVSLIIKGHLNQN